MKLIIDEYTLDLVKQTHNSLILGMILKNGSVNLHVADTLAYPGHREWLADRPGSTPIGGFSLLVKNGVIKAIFALSSLNPAKDARLPEDWIAQIVNGLPADAGLAIYD